jgi:hypothetical protein
MSQIVRCDVCGGVYNKRYLRAHKRLSHGRSQALTASTKSEPETVEAIVSMYAQLSDQSKKTIRDRLANADEETA